MANLIHEFLTENVNKYYQNEIFKDKLKITMTMNEVNEFSNQVANFIIESGVKKGDRIGLFLDTSTFAAAIVFGVIKAGAIYVPINTQSNIESIDNILHSVTAKMLIIDKQYVDRLKKSNYIKKENPVILCNTYDTDLEQCINSFTLKDIQQFESEKVEKQPYIIPKDLVCIIHTSGTSGKPKGVMCRHENIVPFFNYVSKTFGHDETFVTMSRSPLSFDPYLTEIIPNMMKGGKTFFYSFSTLSAFMKTIESEKINDFDCPPSIMNILINNPEYVRRYDFSSIKEIWIGYEYCPISSVKKLKDLFPNAKIIHGYGTTETYASSAFYEVDKIDEKWHSLPIGKPVEGTELLIINEKGEKALPEEEGEMVIRGNSVMPGYWNNQDETNKVFRPNPIFTNSNEIVYYTGDLFVSDFDGNQFYVGRKENFVKINGYRVDLKEIQETLLEVPDVVECQPIKIEVNGIDKIVCFVVLKEESVELKILQKHCREKLEIYKMPYKFIRIEKMPLNSSGKVDFQYLKKIYLKQFGV